MKILFYSSKPYEIEAFNKLNKNHQLTFHTASLNTTESANMAKGYDAVCVFVNDKVDAKILFALKNLNVKFVLLRCAGFNNVDIKAAKKLGIKVARVSSYSPNAVAEHATALLLTLNRHTHKAYNRVREGNFDLNGLIGFDVHGKTVGIIGTGKIGVCFAKIMLGFGCNVLIYDPNPNEEINKLPVKQVDLDTLYKSADIISLHCPLNDSTFHLIDKESLSKMKPGVVLINTGRGALVNAKALVDALKQKRIGALGMDVYEEEADLFFQDRSTEIIQDDCFERLLTFPNVIITGHQGFLTQEALDAIAKTTLENATLFEAEKHCDNEIF